MADSKVCPSCGHANSLDARFCGRCGNALSAAPIAAPAPAPPKPAAPSIDASRGGPQRTMMGAMLDPLPPLVPDPPVPVPVPAKPASRLPNRTMLGGGFEGMAELVKAAAAGAPLPAEPVAAPPAQVQAAPAPAPGFQAPAVSAPAVPVPAVPVPAAPAPAFQALAAPAPASQAPAFHAPAAPAAFVPPAASSTAGLAKSPVVEAPATGPELRAAAPAPRQPMRTMLGAAVPPSVLTAPQSEAKPAAVPEPARPGHKAFSESDAEDMTVREGLGIPPSPPVVPTLEGLPPPAVPSPSGPAPVSAPLAAPVSAPEPAPAASGGLPKRTLGPSNRTMLGVAAPARAASPGPAVAPAAHAPAAQAPTAMAPLSMPNPTSSTTTGDLSIAGLPSPRRRARGWFFALLFIGIVLVGIVIASGVYYRFTRARTDVAASVGTTAAGEVLHVAVTRAPEGSHARFSGADLPLGPTGVDFPLAPEALHVGDNTIAIEVVFPDGSAEPHPVTLTVEYRIRADLSSISSTPPAVTVVIDAVPGSTAVLDAQPFVLDAQGHGTRVCPIEGLVPSADGVIEHVAHYVITPPAPAIPAAGVLTTRVPIVSLHIDRPADGAVTDRATVDVSGAVSVGSTVAIEGGAASVTAEGRFTATVPLAAVGDHEIHIVASGPGRVTASRTLHVSRVADLAREAAAYPIDRALTYARIAAAPVTFQGQHVAIEGRVYNVDLQDGHGVLQLLARDCPAGDRCPLWVTYSAVTEVAVESWVRVVGTVAGEQQFRSQAGEVRTVPHVDATFVLPARP